MGELCLDLKSTIAFKPKSIANFLNEISTISNVSEKLSKVDGYARSLQDEMNKIEAFKRELPLCMLLLNDAIGVLKCETMKVKSGSDVLEKIVPLKGNENDLRDKRSWMRSVQLWGTSIEKHMEEKIVKDADRSVVSSETGFSRNGGGAFVPFKGFLASTRKDEIEREKERDVLLESGLSLVTPGIKRPRAEASPCLMNSKSSVVVGIGVGGRAIPSSEDDQSGLQMPNQSQASRKQRRCWSPDLHRRFLNALQQLGGSQVATPKQIRELMKVDGLTNDEVKSHLQKYRLHTRRYPAPANAPASTPENQKFVLFGGLWVHQDQCGNSKASTSESESPQGPLQLMGTSGGTSTTGDDDSMEDEEDGRSESTNWKGQFYKPGEDSA